MEPSFDSEDMSIFNRSLQLLHSSSSESEYKLLNLAHKSIRKYHPFKSNKTKKFPKDESIKNNEISTTLIEVQANSEPEPVSVNHRDPRINRESNMEPAQSGVLDDNNTRDPRIKATIRPHVTNKIVTCAKTCPFGKNRVAHTLPLNTNFPSAVNLRKIRAVLSRGDPFPMHLTRACINNISPNLQREKL